MNPILTEITEPSKTAHDLVTRDVYYKKKAYTGFKLKKKNTFT